jgi:hypothetical protein
MPLAIDHILSVVRASAETGVDATRAGPPNLHTFIFGY